MLVGTTKCFKFALITDYRLQAGAKHLMTKTHALIAIGVEMASGRIMADDGYPSRDEIRSMAYNSGSLPSGARGLTTDERTDGSARSTGTDRECRYADLAGLAGSRPRGCVCDTHEVS